MHVNKEIICLLLYTQWSFHSTVPHRLPQAAAFRLSLVSVWRGTRLASLLFLSYRTLVKICCPHVSLAYIFTVPRNVVLLLSIGSLEVFIHHLCAPPFQFPLIKPCEFRFINIAPENGLGMLVRCLFCRVASSRVLASFLFQRAKKTISHTSI